MTNKILVGIVITFISLALVSAINMNAGETKYIDLSGEANYIYNITYEVTGNSSNLDGLDISINGNITTITTAYWYKPDTFIITFLINGENYISNPTYGGGGSTSRCYQDWNCSEWSICDGYFQNKTCTSYLNCSLNSSQEKPSELNVCYVQQIPDEVIEEQEEIIEEPEESKRKVSWKLILYMVGGVFVGYGILYLIRRFKPLRK